MSRVGFSHSLHDVFEQPLLLPAAGLPSEASRKRILYTFTPFDNPQWLVFIRSSHDRDATLKWLLAKSILKRLSSEEDFLLTLLGIDSDLIKELISLERSLRNGKSRYPEVGGTQLRDSLVRILNGYTPQISSFKSWKGTKKPFQWRIIGVGYRDKGSLSTAPAWQDQIVGTEEDEARSRDELLTGILALLSFLAFLRKKDTAG